jgi:hypothetical protein
MRPISIQRADGAAGSRLDPRDRAAAKAAFRLRARAAGRRFHTYARYGTTATEEGCSGELRAGVIQACRRPRWFDR